MSLTFVSVIFLGEGVSARYPGKELSKESLCAKIVREKESKKCLKILGIEDYEFSSLLCTQFETYPLVQFVRIIEKKINSFKPNIIFTQNPYEVNIDHTITYKAVEIATRPYKKNFLRAIYSFETVCSGNFAFENKFYPNETISPPEAAPAGCCVPTGVVPAGVVPAGVVPAGACCVPAKSDFITLPVSSISIPNSVLTASLVLLPQTPSTPSLFGPELPKL